MGDTQTIATFTGTLLRRQHTPGQKFVQLLFREGSQNRLCVSSKLSYAALQVGQKYHIEGVFKEGGEKSYIHEPVISREKSGGRTRFRRPLLIASGAMASLLIVGGVVFALHGSSGSDNLQATNTAGKTVVQTTSTPTTTGTTLQPAVTSPTPAAPVTTPVVKKTTTTPKATAATTPVTTAPVIAQPISTAYCDAAVTIPVTYIDQVDDTVDPGIILTVGSPGSQQTCYDDASGSNSHVVVLTTMVSGTKAAAPPQQ